MFKEFQNLKDVPSHYLKEVEHFFATYKELEGVQTETLGWFPADEAIREVKESVERFKQHNAKAQGSPSLGVTERSG
jgi:inorganic pyrophosphatase